jgi:hypothetical protein
MPDIRMIETALKLSDSRLLLFGAVAVDTVCVGSLVILLIDPAEFAQSSSSLLLASLAITAPVLAITVAGSAWLVPKRFDADERARRAILAGAVLHLAVQTNSVLGLLCGCGRRPAGLSAYVATSAFWAFAIVGALVPLALIMRWKTRARPAAVNPPPESKL